MKKVKAKHFGEHLTIDGYGGDYKKLNDKNIVFKVVDKLPEHLGMHKLSKPQIFFAKGNDKKDPGGWSAFVIIEESHIALHTFPHRGFVSADVYTCQNGLDVKRIINYFTKTFDLKKIEKNFIKRGKKYPQENIF